jgi:hypothetical protein
MLKADWSVGGPGARLRRHRNPAVLVVAVSLLVAGAGLAVLGIVALSTETAPSGEEIESRGTVGALDRPATARFTAPSGEPYTVWLSTGAIRRTDREDLVAATACNVTRADGSQARFRGNRQGTSVEVGDLATVGTFTAKEGVTAVACRLERFSTTGGFGRLPLGRGFLVVRGRPSERTRPFLLLFGGLAIAVLAWPVAARWHTGELRPVA